MVYFQFKDEPLSRIFTRSWVTLIFFLNPENIFETFPNPEILRDASHLTRT